MYSYKHTIDTFLQHVLLIRVANQYFMRRDHLITFEEDEFIDDIRDTMASVRHRDFPIINSQGQYLGTIPEEIFSVQRKNR